MFKSKKKPVSTPQSSSQNLTEVEHSPELPSLSGTLCTTNLPGSLKEMKDCLFRMTLHLTELSNAVVI